jgi:hypothetical protein
VDKAMLTRSARELAANMAQRYGLIQPTHQSQTQQAQPQQPQAPQPLQQQAYSSPMAQTQAVPIMPTAVHPAGTDETSGMPPNLTSVPYPNPYTQPPQYPPTVSGVA